MRHKRLSIALILLLTIVLTLEIFQPMIGNASGAVNMWQSAGGVGGVKISAASSKGAWLNTMQGFRITVLGDNGEPSFTYMGKDHLDLLFSEQSLTSCNIYGVSHKTGSGRVAVGSLAELQSVNALDTISGFTNRLINGAYATEAPGDVATAINNLAGLPHHLEGSEFTGEWNKKGSAIKGKLYGPSEDEIMDTAGFYALFNTKMSGIYLWQPKGGFKDDEQSKLASGKMSMIEVMAEREVTISVEPILWNPLRISGTQWSGYLVYGTQTDIGYAIDQLVAAGKFSSTNQAMGGWDEVLFGKGGRSAMVTTKEYKFKGGLTIAVPPQAQSEAVTNKMVMAKSPGWSLHLYTLKPREDEPDIPTTSTYDEPDHPIGGTPPHVQPHKAQDPFEPEDSNFDKETTHVEPDNEYTHYRIVKCYETEKYKSDGVTLIERKSDGLFTTEPTNPIVDIEDEKASDDEFDGSWHLKDWDVSDDYKPPLPDLWEPLTKTYTSKQHGTTEADGISLIDENDEEKVVTLYVHLLRKVKEDEPPEEEETGGTGNIIIQQSQISKTIHTNDPSIGDAPWGNYTFKTQPAANFTLGGF